MEQIMICGRQKFMGGEIPIVAGGFGAGKKCVSDKTIAEIHDTAEREIRRRITENIRRFKENIDFIDLKQRVGESHTLDLLQDLGYAKQSITQAEHIYLLSERGYAKLIKIMDTDLAWEIHDKLMGEYFELRDREDVSLAQKAFGTPFLLCLQGVKFVADDLRIAESSRLMMYNGAFREFGLPTSFLPKYEDNGSRERCSATELLRRNHCGVSAVKFNEMLLNAGFLQIKERDSSKGIKKTFKSLTEKGLKYGVNLISDKNQKESQPYYYADTFMELFGIVSQ